MKRYLPVALIGLLVGLSLNFVSIGAAQPSAVSLSAGESALATCSGTKLTATKESKTSQSLVCTGTVAPPTTTTLPPVTTTTVAPVTPTGPSGSVWTPAPAATWQWIISVPLSVSQIVPGIGVYDIDGFDNPASTVAAIHAAGDHAICYIDVGTAENFRSDYSEFPAALLGKTNGWPGEKWLNTSSSGPDYGILQSIMEARFQMCASKGFDAVEPDNIDGSENSTGFPLTNAQSEAYVEWVASAVHALGMSVAQKNFNDVSSTLEPFFDFAINEQCYQYNECSNLLPYVNAGKAVFEAEYKSCPTGNLTPGLSTVLFDLNLDGKTYKPC